MQAPAGVVSELANGRSSSQSQLANNGLRALQPASDYGYSLNNQVRPPSGYSNQNA